MKEEHQALWLYWEIRDQSSGTAVKSYQRLFSYTSKAKELNHPLTPAKTYQEQKQSGQRDESRELVVKNLWERAQ